jgi:phosphatidylglycerol:prolipoprotein diacylglycerol transferase
VKGVKGNEGHCPYRIRVPGAVSSGLRTIPMRPAINEFITRLLDSPAAVYLIPSSITIYFVAISVTTWLFLRRCKKSGLDPSHSAIAAVLAIVGGLLGARIYYLLQHFDYTLKHREVIFRFGPGIVSWGAYIGGLLPFVLYLRSRKQDVLRYLDILASALGLGPFFIRWACFLNGCCYGAPTDLVWGVRYPVSSFAWHSQLEAGLISSGDPRSLPVHPVQIYLSLSGMLTFVIASRVWRRFARYRGATFLLYWLVYGTARFFLEFLRGDAPRYGPLRLTPSQMLIAVVVCAVCIGSWRLLRCQSRGTSRTSV